MAEDALRVEGLSRTFRGGGGIIDVDLSVRRGEIVALVGLNGAGKTTLLRLLLGMLVPDSGQVLIAGRRLADIPPTGWAEVGQFVDQAPGYPELTVRRNLTIAARLRSVDRPRGVVVDAITAFALEPYAEKRLRRLSLGNRQRVGLAAALQHQPAVIVLDEPGNALDPRGVILIREHLRAASARGAGVLVSSHHLDEVARIADRILVMNRGRLIGELTPAATDLERAFFEAVRIDEEAADVAAGAKGVAP